MNQQWKSLVAALLNADTHKLQMLWLVYAACFGGNTFFFISFLHIIKTPVLKLVKSVRHICLLFFYWCYTQTTCFLLLYPLLLNVCVFSVGLNSLLHAIPAMVPQVIGYRSVSVWWQMFFFHSLPAGDSKGGSEGDPAQREAAVT